jgi:lipoprotein-releasing system permease protein
VFILIIATFNIVGSLSMLILEKEKDIDILWKMGADIYSVRKIFLYEGMLITFIGASIGIILGTAICLIQIYFKLVPIGPGFIIDAYPVKLQIMDYVYIFGSVIVIGLLSSWYPVRAFTSQRLGKVKS